MIRNSFLLILMVLALTACREDEIGPTRTCENPIVQPEQHPKDQALQTLLDQYVGKGLPGIALYVRDANGEWAGSAGFADLERQIPMEPCHVSKIASVTKLFIGTLCMQLVEDGMLNLDDPLTKWLDADMLAKIENADRATLRQVLNHTSGIADVIEDNNFYLAVLNDPGKFWHPDELLHFVYHDDPEFPLGESVGYSNTNLLLASMVIEAATGRSHAELLRERLLDPLGMEDTYYHWHESLPGQTAQGYFDLYNNGDILNLSNFNTGSGNGYGGMYSTVFDIAHFIDALFRDERILSPATMATMLTYTDEEPGNHRAFGITVNKDFLERSPLEFGLGHRGRDLAYTADAYYFPNQEVTMVYLINYGTDAESGLREVFLDYRTALVDLLMSD